MRTPATPHAPVLLRWAAVAVLVVLAVVEIITTGSSWAWLFLALAVGATVYLLRKGAGR